MNRYALLSDHTLYLINQIDLTTSDIDFVKTHTVKRALLKSKGLQLPIASAILRFRNSTIYQVIDQRMYWLLYEGKTYKSGLSDQCKGRN
ncbi:hypothetical protein QNI22_34285 [Cytophagaceae bacterium BD1B2-1]|uniref:Uncharacterized protein n=1 Tax=Xanthocytophaga agilis TaxID=3048010 RepID=A0AAE3R8U0_9BACT|nr:hypothetical protein [Xanthocytophaga agilis]